MAEFVATEPPMTLRTKPNGGAECVHQFVDEQPVSIPDDHALCLKVARRSPFLQEQ